MNTNIFVTASMLKFRYPYKGMITTEDLWDLNLEQLDSIYKILVKEAKALHEDDSLMTKTDHTGEEAVLDMKIEIVKYIFEDRVEAARKHEEEIANAAEKRRILEALAKKRDESLNSMSEGELIRALEELG